MRRLPDIRRPRDPVIALINIVFLMLIFFLIAGTIAPAFQDEVRLVSLSDQASEVPVDAVVLDAGGRLMFGGQTITLEELGAVVVPGAPGRVLPDRDAPADRLLDVTRALQSAGAEPILVMTEAALP